MTINQIAEANSKYLAEEADNALLSGFQMTDVGEIPLDWEVFSLPDVVWYQEGPGLRKWQFKSKGLKVINVTNLQENGNLDLDRTDRHISWDEFESTYKHFACDEGDLVIASSGNSYCKASIVRSCDLPLLMNTSVIRFKPIGEFSKEYMEVYLKSPYFKDQIDLLITGGAQPNFGPAHLNLIKIPAPKCAKEQTAIANALSDVDALICELEKLIAKKQAIKTATMQQLLTGRTRLPQFALREDGTPKGYKQSELGEIPEDWEVVELSELITSHNAGVYKAKSQYGSGTNIVGVGDIYDISKVDGRAFRKVPLTEEEKRRFLLEEGDLIYGESSLVREGIARTVYVDGAGAGTAFAWHTRRYQVNKGIVNSEYLYYYLTGNMARSHMINNSITTALTGINTVAYFACPIFLPSQDEQAAIATILSNMDEEIQALGQRLGKTRQIKQGMMQDLLTGKTRLIEGEQHD